MHHPEAIRRTTQNNRHKTRLATLNVSSVSTKETAIEQYLADNRVHTAVITETHAQQGNEDNLQLRGYSLVSTCCRQQGELKGWGGNLRS